MRSRKDILISALIIAIGFWAVFVLSSYLEKNRITVPESYDDEDLAFQGKKLKGYALGAEGLLSDWYWMRALQYIGGKIVKTGLDQLNLDDLTGLNPRLLYPMLDNATDLDPKSMAPFSYGATILPTISSEQAIKLTEKGIAHNPDNWRLYQYLGYIHWRLKDYEKAAATYDQGANIPGAPDFFRWMAARMHSEISDRETARAIYNQMVSESQDEQSKLIAEHRLKEFDSMDQSDAVDQALQTFKERTGRCANKIAEVIPLLRTVKLPYGKEFQMDKGGNLVNPFGNPFGLDTETCKSTSINVAPRLQK